MRKTPQNGVFLLYFILFIPIYSIKSRKLLHWFVTFTIEQLQDILNQKRGEVVEEVLSRKKGESRKLLDVDKFDSSLYNEITLSTQERNRVQSAMMTWKYAINAPNYVNLSNGYIYLAKIDENGEVHIYEKVLSKNIHQKGDAYVKQTRRKFNNVVQIVRNEQGSNNRSINFDKNGQDSGTVVTSNNRQVRSKRNSNGRGYFQNDNDVSSTQERKGIVYFDASQEEDRRLSINVTAEDVAYLNAVKRGDMAKAQEMIDKVAKETEYTIKAYHGSRNIFNVFDKAKLGSNTKTETSKRWFFAADEKTANSYYPYGIMKKSHRNALLQ